MTDKDLSPLVGTQQTIDDGRGDTRGDPEARTVVGSHVRRRQGDKHISHDQTLAASATTRSVVEQLTLTTGLRIHQYELIREIGAGGMGRVFLARDTKLGRLVAMKFLITDSRRLAERFLIEARATAQCSHENIVVIHEVGEFNGHPFMVLQYLEGVPLSSIVKGRPLAEGRAIELIVPVVRALVRAHEFGIVHRDLKPDNIFVTEDGVVKVLDFGIAKALTTEADAPLAESAPTESGVELALGLTGDGALMGTLPYMSPEQCGLAEVDHRTDIWAVGIILYEMLAGQHPLAPITPHRLLESAVELETPMPKVDAIAPSVSERLARVVDRCLQKQRDSRIGAATELLELTEAMLPNRSGRRLADGESPYPGLSSFQEGDADRFFGRARDITKLVARMRDVPLVGVVGPSGVGKSSFVRAGLVPALKAGGESWQVLIARPGRDPLAGLATLLQPLTTSSATDVRTKMQEHDDLVARLRQEPGYLGAVLRSQSRQQDCRILLFVDQFEELYTLVADDEERTAYKRCLSGVGDDASTPLRVIISLRSDFLDRAADDQLFMDELARGLHFLAPPDAAGLRDALTHPIHMVDYHFESEATVDDMLNALASTPGALPLLQFAAAKLWDGRDREKRLLTDAAYEAMGGVTGTLATHADEVIGRLSQSMRRTARLIFQRLVTLERTRAIVDAAELHGLAANPADARRLLDQLVQARLLVIQSRGESEGPAVEIVHESLIEEWPTLRGWLDESHDDAAFLAQLRTTSKQWRVAGKPPGLLWRGEAMQDAQRWRRRTTRPIASNDQAYLDAVFRLGNRARRIRRIAIGSVIAVLAVVATGATLGMLSIREAEQAATKETAKALTAQQELGERVTELEREKGLRKTAVRQRKTAVRQRKAAEVESSESKGKLQQKDAQLKQTLDERAAVLATRETALKERAKAVSEKAAAFTKLGAALKTARADRKKAEAAKAIAEAKAREAKQAKLRLEHALTRERIEKEKYRKKAAGLTTKLRK